MIVAIDGPCGSGKSEAAKEVALRLENFTFVNTGRLYRAVALAALLEGICTTDREAVAACLPLDIQTEYDAGGVQRTFLNKVDVTGLLDCKAPKKGASDVANNDEVRRFLLQKQRDLAFLKENGVLEGRDIGSVVFPDAEVKIFLFADENVRARRRMKDGTSFEEALADVQYRDEQDRTREYAPLVQTDAHEPLDNTHMNLEETVQAIIDIIQKRRAS